VAGWRVRLDEGGGLEVEGIPGRTLMTGYLHDAEATAAAFAPGEGARVWLRTGDLFTVDEEGNFRFAGRKKDLIKVGGENVAALEVERVLCAHPAVLEAAAIGVPDAVLDEVVKAFVVLRDGARADGAELVAWCGARLADFKTPRAVEVRAELPRVTLDKIDKQALRRAEGAR
jgi:crotonobetaine/carnitine-CoA ligase